MKTYTYDPALIPENGKDRMRFELGDTMVEGAEETCALTDEEYTSILKMQSGNWRKAKLECLRSITQRFMFEVDTRVGPLSLALSERAKLWKQMYDEAKADSARMAVPSANPNAISPMHYFREGIHDNHAGAYRGRETNSACCNAPASVRANRSGAAFSTDVEMASDAEVQEMLRDVFGDESS